MSSWVPLAAAFWRVDFLSNYQGRILQNMARGDFMVWWDFMVTKGPKAGGIISRTQACGYGETSPN